MRQTIPLPRMSSSFPATSVSHHNSLVCFRCLGAKHLSSCYDHKTCEGFTGNCTSIFLNDLVQLPSRCVAQAGAIAKRACTIRLYRAAFPRL
jgi:hypothetical protein